MYSALLYKEWLKIRWALLGTALLSLLTLIFILLNTAYYIELYTPKGFWSFVILQKYPFFTDIQYIPALAGLVIAAAQFSPEMNSSRLKLTFHLPVRENLLLFQMLSIGFGLLIILFSITMIFLGIISGFFFPAQVVLNVLNISLPWFAGGLTAYFLASVIIIEPVWSRRLVFLPFALGFIDLYFSAENPHYNLELFFILSGFLASILILLPGYHFKRGIK